MTEPLVLELHQVILSDNARGAWSRALAVGKKEIRESAALMGVEVPVPLKPLITIHPDETATLFVEIPEVVKITVEIGPCDWMYCN